MAVDRQVVKVRRLAAVPMPRQATAGSAGFDLHAAEAATVPAGRHAMVRTGLAIEMPDGIEAQVRPRSGLAAGHGIGILNSPGTIDSDYRGEVRVVLFNVSDTDFAVQPGDRVAQLVFSRALAVDLVESDRLADTGRGAGGFGHTG